MLFSPGMMTLSINDWHWSGVYQLTSRAKSSALSYGFCQDGTWQVVLEMRTLEVLQL